MATLKYEIDDFDFSLDPTGIEEFSSSENPSRQKIDRESSEEDEDCESSKITAIIDLDTKELLNSVSGQISSFKLDSIPGTYEHFLVLLFESSENMLEKQTDMQHYLERHHFNQLKRVYNSSKEDAHDFLERELLTSELQTLRELLAPIRVNADTDANALSEINSIENRDEDVDVTKQSLERAADIISEFDISQKKKNGLSRKSSYEERLSASRSLRLARLDVCKSSIANRLSTASNKAFAGSSQTLTAQQLTTGQHLGYELPCSKKFMTETAQWLAKARNTTAVDLFCDVGQLFSISSKQILTDEELLHLCLLSTLYPLELTTQHIGNPWVGYDSEMPNSQYFRNCEASQESMMARVCAGPAPRTGKFTPPRRQGFQLTSDSHRPATEP